MYGSPLWCAQLAERTLEPMNNAQPARDRADEDRAFLVVVTEIRCRICHVWVARNETHRCEAQRTRRRP